MTDLPSRRRLAAIAGAPAAVLDFCFVRMPNHAGVQQRAPTPSAPEPNSNANEPFPN
jgi:hypothetical protein